MSDQLELFEPTMEEIVRKAQAEGRIPQECIEEIEISEDMIARAVNFHEC